MLLLPLCEFFGQHGLTHLLAWQSRSFVLERLSATDQSNLEHLEEIVQLCLIMALDFFYDLAFPDLRNGIPLAMTVRSHVPAIRIARALLLHILPDWVCPRRPAGLRDACDERIVLLGVCQ